MSAVAAALTCLAVAAPGSGERAGATPVVVTVATARGEQQVAVRADENGAPVLAAVALAAALQGDARVAGPWAEVTLADRQFRFLIGAPLYVFNRQLQPLAATVSLSRDTVLLPLQFVAEILPRSFGGRFRYESDGARLVELGPNGPAAVAAAPVARAMKPEKNATAPSAREPAGLGPSHVVTIDPGHGGVDPGNLGLFFPRGVREKDVTLQVGLFLRDELRRRGVGVRMTRSTDTLIDLHDRGAFCSATCDLFLSLHVNSVPKRRDYTKARGFETYFLAEAKTQEAARVAQMENEAVRFEGSREAIAAEGGLDFILKDLQLNEYLRESARVAELVQRSMGTVHPGPSRGVKQAGFMVLTTARRPAILVEMGYSTNPQDGKLLTNRGSQKRLAAAIAGAVVEYLTEYDRKTGAAAVLP